MKKILLRHWGSLIAIVPFSMFIIGYIGTYLFVQQQEFIVPELVGKNMQEAIVALSELHVGISLLAEKEEQRVAPGVILNQVPIAGSKIRAYKNILVVVSKKSQVIKAPRCLGKSFEEVDALCKATGIFLKPYFITSIYPKNCCIVQYPEQGAAVFNDKLVAYFSEGREPLYVFPDFSTILKSDAEYFLKTLSADVDFFEEGLSSRFKQSASLRIIEQNPLPGTIFDSSQFMYIQFRLQ